MEKVDKSEQDWRGQLTAEQYQVARCSATEMPFSGEYWDHHEDGVYNCVCCGTPLFDSSTKFDSGSGWPSFYQPTTKENVAAKSDTSHGMMRTEVLCARCDAHLGHVFPDGPRPTGLRYCMNGVSLKFEPEA